MVAAIRHDGEATHWHIKKQNSLGTFACIYQVYLISGKVS